MWKETHHVGRIAKILSNNEKYTEINSVYHFLERIFWVSPNSTIPSIFPGFYDNDSLNTILSTLDTGVTGLDFTPLAMEEQPFDQEELDLSTSIDMQMGEFRTKMENSMPSFMATTVKKETLKSNMSVFATVVVKIMNTFSIGIRNHRALEK